jgi:hypothetical protein
MLVNSNVSGSAVARKTASTGSKCVDGPHYFGLKSCATQSRGTAAHQIIRTPRNGAACFHTAIFLSPHPMKHPTLEGWWRGHLQTSMAA